MNKHQEKVAEIIREELNTSKGLNYRERSLIDALADLYKEEAFNKGCDLKTGKHLEPFNKTLFLKKCGVKG